MKNGDQPAFPEHKLEPVKQNGYGEVYEYKLKANGGLTKREYAAIKLRVADSGDPDIDKMIVSATRRDFAGLAMQGLIPVFNGDHSQELAKRSLQAADELLKQLNE